ncbi:MAG TPA: sensor domain-containing diguanylate cyclase [Pyrinomonadaceae bacterium]|nr:sensor domain-containing diguanylate cyclase [Pyrinomonadaceae bacterium]
MLRTDAFIVFIPIVAGLGAIAATFYSATTLTGYWRIAAVAFVSALFVTASFVVRSGGARVRKESVAIGPATAINNEFEGRLVALDEANEFFGTSLNAADMFRLISDRVNEIFPFGASALLVPTQDDGGLKFIHFDGAHADQFIGLELDGSRTTAENAYHSRNISINNDLSADRKAVGEDRLNGFSSAAAIPLSHSDGVFGVFLLYTADPIGTDRDTVKVIETIGEHVTPIFRNSLEFERSLSNALTDTITGLPNERAFFMVLENQLAESIRNRDERPLSVLTIDIRDFGAVNSMLGHSTGDRMLEFAGARISEYLRKMDFLARTVNDEFGVVLPTASEKTAQEIVERIREGFASIEFDISGGESVFIELNIGCATFWKDGETADQLVRTAQQRKRQAKSEQPAGVLWFPKEYVN